MCYRGLTVISQFLSGLISLSDFITVDYPVVKADHGDILIVYDLILSSHAPSTMRTYKSYLYVNAERIISLQ